MLTVIFSSSCEKYKPTIHSLDLPNKVFNRYKVTKFNKDTCQLELADESSISMTDLSLNGLVCLTAKEYAIKQSEVKAECENAKPKTQNP